MPRGVAKAKDGVEKKGKEVGKKDDVKRDVGKKDDVKKDVGKKDVVVKRNRKMKGGGSFKEYCNKFLEEGTNKDSFNNAKEYAKKYFNLMTIEMNKKDLTKWGRASYEQKEKLKILDYINITKQDNDSKLYDSINNLKEVLEYIQKIPNLSIINEYNSKELCKHILFIKIYKLFLNFKELASTEPFSSISIDKPRSSEDKKILQGIAETIFESIPDDLKTKVTTDVLDKVLRDNNIEDYIITEIFLILSNKYIITLKDFTQAFLESSIQTSVNSATSQSISPATDNDNAILERMKKLYNINISEFTSINKDKEVIYARFKGVISNMTSNDTAIYTKFNLKDYFADFKRRNYITEIKTKNIKDIRDTISSIKTKTNSVLFNAIYIDSLEKELKEFESVIDIWLKTINKNIN